MTKFAIAKTFVTSRNNLGPLWSPTHRRIIHAAQKLENGETGKRFDEWMITPVPNSDLAIISSVHGDLTILHEVMDAELAPLWVTGRKVQVNPATGAVEVLSPELLALMAA